MTSPKKSRIKNVKIGKKFLQDLLQINKEKNRQTNGQKSQRVTEKELEMAFQHMKDAQPNS